MENKFEGTTILSVRHQGKIAIAGDGQVTIGNTVMKHNARKIRRMYKDQVIAGFAGSVADSFALFGKFEEKLEKAQGNLQRAAVELAKEWRTDKILRRLEAMLIVVNKDSSFLLSGNGDVIEPDDGIIGIGSGGTFAISAARALLKHSNLSAKEIVEESMKIAADICVYTNDRIIIEEI